MEFVENMTRDDIDFWRCHHCGRLITAVQMTRSLARTPSGSYPEVCLCGSQTFEATNLRWYDWFKFRVLWFAYLRLRGKA
jgi:hypothetical protein